MSCNGRLLALAREKLEKRREENRAEQQRRTAAVYARLPAVREADENLRAQMIELMGLALRRDGDISARVKELEARNLALQAQRAEMLTGAGLPVNYTDEIYSCPKCRDTGMVDGVMCSCLKKLYNQELTASLGTLLRCGDESFGKFDLSYYEGADRECMDMVKNTCMAYAAGFGPRSTNLLFQGGAGLGKTLLSACIARVVAEKGFSVAYESASAALEAFEAQKFSRDTQEAEQAAGRVKQYLACDLMILDDLGTEMITSFSVSALYQIINGRLINEKKTVISTNLSDEELTRKYGAPIMSRLCGEYDFLPFVGRDIRLIKKDRGEK